MSAHHEQGREARLAGKPSSECPFAVGGPEWVHWMDGWNEVDFSFRVDAVREELKDVNVAIDHSKPAPVCPNCGEPGAHFVPPCLGGEGFYVCETLRRLDSAVEPEDAPAGD